VAGRAAVRDATATGGRPGPPAVGAEHHQRHRQRADRQAGPGGEPPPPAGGAWGRLRERSRRASASIAMLETAFGGSDRVGAVRICPTPRHPRSLWPRSRRRRISLRQRAPGELAEELVLWWAGVCVVGQAHRVLVSKLPLADKPARLLCACGFCAARQPDEECSCAS
jgi:hypothetical protein